MYQKKDKINLIFFFRIVQGALIGLGAVLPGISGGVLSVIFGIYKPIMELLSNPVKNYRSHIPPLIPVFTGSIIGFFGVANILSFFLEKYPTPSVCVFIGLIIGMLPSLFHEAGKQGRSNTSYISMFICMITISAILLGFRLFCIEVRPGFGWYLFCGFCLALSIIAPGMSFSTLLMPLGLYTPFMDGIGHFSLNILLPAAIGTIATIVCLAKGINALFDRFYSVAFHGIIGIVISATVMIIPFRSFLTVESCIANLICISAGIAAAFSLDKFNRKVKGD